MGLRTENPILIDDEQDRRTLLLQPHQSPRNYPIPLCWWEVAYSKQELKTFPYVFTEICLNIV